MLLTPFANNLINLAKRERNRGNKHWPKQRPVFWAYFENFFWLLLFFSPLFLDRGEERKEENLFIDTLLGAAHDSQDTREHGQLASNWLAISILQPFAKLLTSFELSLICTYL